jgi:DNA polymerase III subunit chi
MTEISFHFNASDKQAHACRVIRKAFNTGLGVCVVGDAHDLVSLDSALWSFSALDFIPHCHATADFSLLVRSPVVLGIPENADFLHYGQQMLINLGSRVPDGFERFQRLIEMVGLSDADRLTGRARWKHYASRGYALVRHDLAG